MIRCIATGTGRCGTGYMAKLMASAGFSPTTHEGVFGPNGPDTGQLLDDVPRYESSWLAAPFLSACVAQGSTIIHLLRHPLHVMSSMISIGFYAGGPYLRYVRSFIQLPDAEPTVAIAAAHWIAWNRLINEQHPHLIFRVDSDDPEQLVRTLGGGTHQLFEERRYNTAPRSVHLKWSDVPSPYRELLAEAAATYGYY